MAPEVQRPARRPLRVYSFDPQIANTLERIGPGIVTVDVPWERLKPGPAGARVKVVDFDGGRQENGRQATTYYTPVDLEDPDVAVQAGLAPNETDPRFHQQMVYAAAMRTFDGFDRALGRRVRPKGGSLTLIPHAFRGRNAFYDPDQRAVLFGYFQADVDDPGPNLPGQLIYTCLSHDITSHEVSHAILHRIRPWLLERTNPDVGALHEAIGDIAAIFLHFTLPGVVASVVATTRSDLRDPTPLVELAQQFGYATGRNGALRTAVDIPDPSRYKTELEPHARGAILVAAVFDAFLTVYRRRTVDLIRLATGGTGNLPPGALPPDLVNRVSREAIRAAKLIMTMCIRALDYLPAVDANFSDFLRAVVTADRELYPSDSDGIRTAFVDAFRRRGIYPQGVASLAEAALAWEGANWPTEIRLPARDRMLARDVVSLNPHLTWTAKADANIPIGSDPTLGDERGIAYVVAALEQFAKDFHIRLGLADPAVHPVHLEDFVSTFRYDEDGAPRVSFVVQWTQAVASADAPGLPSEVVDKSVRRGVTLIADGSGVPQYVITKPAPGPDVSASEAAAGSARLSALADWVEELAWTDSGRGLGAKVRNSSPLRIDLAAMHRAGQ